MEEHDSRAALVRHGVGTLAFEDSPADEDRLPSRKPWCLESEDESADEARVPQSISSSSCPERTVHHTDGAREIKPWKSDGSWRRSSWHRTDRGLTCTSTARDEGMFRHQKEGLQQGPFTWSSSKYRKTSRATMSTWSSRKAWTSSAPVQRQQQQQEEDGWMKSFDTILAEASSNGSQHAPAAASSQACTYSSPASKSSSGLPVQTCVMSDLPPQPCLYTDGQQIYAVAAFLAVPPTCASGDQLPIPPMTGLPSGTACFIQCQVPA